MPLNNLIIVVVTPWRTNKYTVQAKGNVETDSEIVFTIQCECMSLFVRKCLNRPISWILFWGGQRCKKVRIKWKQNDVSLFCHSFFLDSPLLHRACATPPTQITLHTSCFFPSQQREGCDSCLPLPVQHAFGSQINCKIYHHSVKYHFTATVTFKVTSPISLCRAAVEQSRTVRGCVLLWSGMSWPSPLLSEIPLVVTLDIFSGVNWVCMSS